MLDCGKCCSVLNKWQISRGIFLPKQICLPLRFLLFFPCTLDGHAMSPRREFPAIPQSWTIASVLDADKDKLAWDLVASPVSTTVPSEDGDDEHAPAVLAAKANAPVVEAAIVADKGLTPAASIEAASTFDDSADEQLELCGDLGKRDKKSPRPCEMA